MREQKVEFTFKLHEKGDFVRTPEGVGIVVEEEPEYETLDELIDADIMVQHKSGLSCNPENEVREVSREYIQVITEQEYNDADE